MPKDIILTLEEKKKLWKKLGLKIDKPMIYNDTEVMARGEKYIRKTEDGIILVGIRNDTEYPNGVWVYSVDIRTKED